MAADGRPADSAAEPLYAENDRRPAAVGCTLIAALLFIRRCLAHPITAFSMLVAEDLLTLLIIFSRVTSVEFSSLRCNASTSSGTN